MCVPAIAMVAIPGITIDRLLSNNAAYHINVAKSAARSASFVLQEAVPHPYLTNQDSTPAIAELEPGDVIPTEEEHQKCPGGVLQLVVLNPSREAVEKAADAMHVNPLQRDFLHKANNNIVTILDGPPGTGKTSTLLALAAVWALSAAPGFAVVITGTGNAALDNITKRLHKAIDEGRIGLLPLGRSLREEVSAEGPGVLPYTPEGIFEEKTGRTFQPGNRQDMTDLAYYQRHAIRGGQDHDSHPR